MIYKQSINDNPRIAKPLMMIAVGLNSRKEIIDKYKGIRATTWDNRYRPTLLKQNKEGDIHSAYIIEESHEYKNQVVYNLNYNLLIDTLKNLIIKDIRTNQMDIIAAMEKIRPKILEAEKDFNVNKKASERDIGSKLITDDWGRTLFEDEETNKKLFLKRIKFHYYKALHDEYKDFSEKITGSLKFIEVEFNKLKKDTSRRNWLICQLIKYFREVLYSREKTLSINDELRNWLLALSFKEYVDDSVSYEDSKRFPFMLQKDYRKTFFKICQDYSYYKNMQIEWLIINKPKKEKQDQESLKTIEEDEARLIEDS